MLEGGELPTNGDLPSRADHAHPGPRPSKGPGPGYAKTFLRQLEDCLGLALDKGVKIVSNAGGLNPHGLAVAIRELSDRLGLDAQVAFVSGDDLIKDAGKLRLRQPVDRQRLPRRFRYQGTPTAVPTSSSPAASPTHRSPSDPPPRPSVGTTGSHRSPAPSSPATSSNAERRRQPPFFTEIPMGHLGFPIAEISADGSSSSPSTRGTGGRSPSETVTAAALYEAGGPVTSTQTSPRAWTPPNSPRPARIASRSAVCGREPAERPQGLAQLPRRPAQPGRRGAHGPRHRREGSPLRRAVPRCPSGRTS